jgi:hypothetical protein
LKKHESVKEMRRGLVLVESLVAFSSGMEMAVETIARAPPNTLFISSMHDVLLQVSSLHLLHKEERAHLRN